MKILTINNLWLQFQSEGTLLPWIGPALRGILLRRLKKEACHQPEDEQETIWEHCRGCPYNRECSYGSLFEPDFLDCATNKLDPELVKLLNGRQEPPRPVVLAPAYPACPADDCMAQPGMILPIRLQFMTEQSAAHAEWVIDRLDAVGRQGLLGKDRIRFRVDSQEARESWSEFTAEMLPATIEPTAGFIPRLGIGLTAPMFLEVKQKEATKPNGNDRSRRSKGESRVAVMTPSFEELFCAARDAVRAHLTIAGNPPPRLDMRTWGAAARSVALVEHCFERFPQKHTQSRHGKSRTLLGTFGGGVYANVPWSFLPWLHWGGLLHVGEERVSGAGGWRVLLNP